MATAPPKIYTLSLHDALPICGRTSWISTLRWPRRWACCSASRRARSEEHTSELQSRGHLVCRLLLEKKKEVLKGQANPKLSLVYAAFENSAPVLTPTVRVTNP